MAERLGEPEQRGAGGRRNGHLDVDDLDLALDDAGHIHGHGDGDDRLRHPLRERDRGRDYTLGRTSAAGTVTAERTPVGSTTGSPLSGSPPRLPGRPD